MELKLQQFAELYRVAFVLIVLYGIETTKALIHGSHTKVLIVLYGIETECNLHYI